MKRTTLGVISGVAVALLLVGFVPLSQAAGPAGMKLYAFSSGGLTIAKSALQSGAPSTQVTEPVGFFVVKHPKGTLLFDTGATTTVLSEKLGALDEVQAFIQKGRMRVVGAAGVAENVKMALLPKLGVGTYIRQNIDAAVLDLLRRQSGVFGGRNPDVEAPGKRL